MIKKTLKIVGLVVLAAVVIIQFIRPAQNTGVEIATERITALHLVPEPVERILSISCYDCHSNTTHYPWYSQIQPVGWFLNKHIVEGKKELNFSTFSADPLYRQHKKFKEIRREMRNKTMPLASYTWLHHDAQLNDEQRLLIGNWAEESADQMEAKYPAESLKRPKQ